MNNKDLEEKKTLSKFTNVDLIMAGTYVYLYTILKIGGLSKEEIESILERVGIPPMDDTEVLDRLEQIKD